MNAATRGSLYLVPNTLDFGARSGVPPLQQVLPLGVIEVAARLTHWVAENAKTTRAFLKRVDAVVALAQPLQAIDIHELPRPQKGRNAASPAGDEWSLLLAPALRGEDTGLISEAGLPAVADPGAALVDAAHRAGLRVIALPGPSSLMLALAASGLNGQSFAFVGYLPVDAAERGKRIRELEALSRRERQTQLMIETPYRNEALLAALLAHLGATTRLSISCGLTLADGFSRTDSVSGWKAAPTTLPADLPVVFSLLAA
ncbi:MAG TPA: SAM-dependent methyltransferase [Burkholderiaceae bacterium]|nr:SAM-dependent methyltransferase [Burkholderiaceae bacterium]